MRPSSEREGEEEGGGGSHRLKATLNCIRGWWEQNPFRTMAFMTTLQKEKGVPFCDTEIQDIVDSTLPIIGRRICDLKQLIVFCQDKHCSSVQAVKSLVEIFATWEKKQCKFFLNNFRNNVQRRKAMQLFQELIQNSEVDLTKFYQKVPDVESNHCSSCGGSGF